MLFYFLILLLNLFFLFIDLLLDRKKFKTLPPYDSYIFMVYDSCMNNKTRNNIKSQPLLDKFEE